MSGQSSRFSNAGFKLPKPLITVDNILMIEHVKNMFASDDMFLFICTHEQLNDKTFKLREKLLNLNINSKIIGIDSHNMGPVYSVLQITSHIDFQSPVIVNYCDFSCDWSYDDFKNFVESKNLDGAIPCYKGFHPHTLWSNYYAYVKEKNLKAIDIQEKESFTNNPRMEYASSGTYYFKSGKLMIHYFKNLYENNVCVNGEFYVSLAYKKMIKDGLNISVYKLNHFMQWGTPEDLRDYQYWSNTFSNLHSKNKKCSFNGTIFMPMSGEGKRFQKKYSEIKPLIKINNKPMFVNSFEYLPESKNRYVIVNNHQIQFEIENNYSIYMANTHLININQKTNGQAVTCYEALNNIELNEPITISARDFGTIYESSELSDLLDDINVDIIVWTAVGYPGAIRTPKSYGWVEIDKKTNEIKKVKVKEKLNDPSTDHVIVGTFSFKKNEYFLKCYDSLIKRNFKVNGEYYVDSLINDAINLGYKCKIFEVKSYICWGTPDDLDTFNYWDNCFDNWKYHPYSKKTLS